MFHLTSPQIYSLPPMEKEIILLYLFIYFFKCMIAVKEHPKTK